MATSNYMLSNTGKADEKAAAVTRAQWERYQNLYTPVENDLIGSLDENNSLQTSALAGQAADRSVAANQRMQSRLGATNPNADVAARQQQIARQQAVGDAFNTADLARVDRRSNVRGSLIDAGQSLVNQATGGLASSASAAGQRESAYTAQKAQAKQQRNAATTSLLTAGITAAFMI